MLWPYGEGARALTEQGGPGPSQTPASAMKRALARLILCALSFYLTPDPCFK